MLEQYIKLFYLEWVEPWMVEAIALVGGGLLLALIIVKIIDFLEQVNQ
jgi:hypothetical protein